MPYPYLLEKPERNVAAMPSDLVSTLGPDGAQALWAWAARHDGFLLPSESDGWWASALPGFTVSLLRDAVYTGETAAREEGYALEDVSLAQEAERAAIERAAECSADIGRRWRSPMRPRWRAYEVS